MKKLIIPLLALLIISASCKKKGNYTCRCITPFGTQSEHPYSGEYKSALSDCDSWQKKYRANTAYATTQCSLK